jgi:preprotein translocase subunit SecG
MDTVVIVIHLMVIVALIAVVLVQRSEGGALGIGASNNFLTGRSSGNVFTRATAILGAAFFATSLVMTILSRLAAPPSSILDTVPTAGAPVTPPAVSDTVQPEAPVGNGAGGILDELESFTGQSGGAGTSTTAPAEPGAPPAEPPAAPAEPQVPTNQ